MIKEPQYLEVINEKGAVLILLDEDIKMIMEAKFEEDGINIKVNISRVIKKKARNIKLGDKIDKI